MTQWDDLPKVMRNDVWRHTWTRCYTLYIHMIIYMYWFWCDKIPSSKPIKRLKRTTTHIGPPFLFSFLLARPIQHFYGASCQDKDDSTRCNGLEKYIYISYMYNGYIYKYACVCVNAWNCATQATQAAFDKNHTVATYWRHSPTDLSLKRRW